MSLGDIGVIDRGGWRTITSLKRKGIDFEVHLDVTPDRYLTLGAGKVSEVKLGLNGEVNPPSIPVGQAKLGVSVSFDNAGEFYLQAHELVSHRIKYLDEVERAVLALAQQNDKWEKQWLFVTEVMEAQRSLVIVANEAGANVALDLGLEVKHPVIDLGKASAEARVASRSKVEVVNLSLTPKVLTHAARKVEKGWWWTKEVVGYEQPRYLESSPIVDATLADVQQGLEDTV